mgnify:CR=1 FL=1
MGRDQSDMARLEPSRDFNPRARMGRDLEEYIPGFVAFISIHAPAWGATEDAEVDYKALRISIHAPAWGATRKQFPLCYIRQFQSTRPHGARQKLHRF